MSGNDKRQTLLHVNQCLQYMTAVGIVPPPTSDVRLVQQIQRQILKDRDGERWRKGGQSFTTLPLIAAQAFIYINCLFPPSAGQVRTHGLRPWQRRAGTDRWDRAAFLQPLPADPCINDLTQRLTINSAECLNIRHQTLRRSDGLIPHVGSVMRRANGM